MTPKLFEAALLRKNTNRPPVWFMRQAGRYHTHYQELRRRYSFLDLCYVPELACEATLGPIRDFSFDAAILFSDLLFPLQALGMGLSYQPKPQLDWYLRSPTDLTRLQNRWEDQAEHPLSFQQKALRLIRQQLSPEKGLLGFVGGPLTLYCYAVEGSHQGDFESARQGFQDGRWMGFLNSLKELWVQNIGLQLDGGADTVAILDTCAGEWGPLDYAEHIIPVLTEWCHEVKKRYPQSLLTYYSKKTGPAHWQAIHEAHLPFDCLGVDWLEPLPFVLKYGSPYWAIQGNIDPHWLLLETPLFEKKLEDVFEAVSKLPATQRQGWICGLGHGILPETPEAHVRLFLKKQQQFFSSC